MEAKKITIVFVPEGSNKVRQLRIPKSFLVVLVLFFLSAAACLAWVITDYVRIKEQAPRLAQLKKENKQQRRQLIALTQRIDQISGKMREIDKFDRRLRIMVNLDKSKAEEENEEETQFLGVGGSNPALSNPDYSIEKAHKSLVRLLYQSLDHLNTRIAIKKDEKEELYKFLEERRSTVACTPSIWPTRGWISSRFGYRISPFTNEREFHKGIDICTRMNAAIVAPADGLVSSIRWDAGYGKMLILDHGYGMRTKYAHLSSTLVKKGEYVKRGQEIAQVGKSGRTTGPHLHYEVHLNGVPMNPLRYVFD